MPYFCLSVIYSWYLTVIAVWFMILYYNFASIIHVTNVRAHMPNSTSNTCKMVSDSRQLGHSLNYVIKFLLVLLKKNVVQQQHFNRAVL